MAHARFQSATFLLLGLVVGVVVTGAIASVYLIFDTPDQMTNARSATTGTDQLEADETGRLLSESSLQNTEISALDLQKLSRQSKFSRTKELHNHLLTADSDSVTNFLYQSQNIEPSSLRRQVQEAAILRLAMLDPSSALDEVNSLSSPYRNSWINVVFKVWSVDNLEGAVAHARGLSETDRRDALEGILHSRNDLSDDARREVARQLGHEQVLIDSQFLSLAGEAVADPELAWTKFLRNHGGDVAFLSEAQLAVLENILDSWIDQGFDPKVASIVSSALETGGNESAVQMLLETLARVDPTVAFQATTSIADIEQRKQMQEAIVNAWIDLDSLVVLDSTGLIPSELEDWSKQQALVALSETSPAAAAKRLEMVSDPDSKRDVARSITTNWARLDPDAARDWINSDSALQVFRGTLMYRLIEEASQVDAAKAFKWALEEPVAEYARGRGLEQTVIHNVALQGNYEMAVSMAKQARDTPNQQWSYVSIGNVLVTRGKSDEAWSLMEEMPKRLQSLYMSQVVNNWVWAEPDIAFESMESLSSQEMKESLANSLFFEYQSHRTFSTKQVSTLKKYLPEWLHHHIE